MHDSDSEFTKWRPAPLMEWAKTGYVGGTFNLSRSGVLSIPDFRELPGGPFVPKSWGTNYAGHEGLRATIAALYGAQADQILIAQGASQCYGLISGSILSGGGTAIVETPVYEPMLRSVEIWADRIVRLPRRREDHYQPDPDEFGKLLDSKTKLVALTNLHNPTHVAIEPEILKSIIMQAHSAGAEVMVDEVFMPMVEPDHSKHGFGSGAISICSLGKSWGLDAIRVGWAVGPKEVVHRAYRLNNLMGVNQPFMTEDLAYQIMNSRPAMDYMAERTRGYLHNRPLLENFVSSTPEVSWEIPTGGLSGLVHLPVRTDDRRFCEELLAKYDTVLFPGSFFECPAAVRVSFSDSADIVEEGLRRFKSILQA